MLWKREGQRQNVGECAWAVVRNRMKAMFLRVGEAPVKVQEACLFWNVPDTTGWSVRLETSKKGKGLLYCMVLRDAEHIHFEDVVT